MSLGEGKGKPAPPLGAGSDRQGQELRAVNERLRDVIEELRSQRERMGARLQEATSAPETPAAPREERDRLETELSAARDALDHQRFEEKQLRERLAEVERERHRMSDDYVAAEEQNSNLAALYVALSRLHASLERREVLSAIQEIVINMVGSEELALFELGGDGRLTPVHSFGVDVSRLPEQRLGSGAIGRAAAAGEVYVAGEGPRGADPDLTACVPIKAGGRVTGAIAIWRLLGHKPFLEEFDHQIFDVLATHAGSALYLATLHERHGGDRS